MGKLLPVLLAVLGLGVGVGAGFFLRPPAATGDTAAGPKDATPAAAPDPATVDYVKLSNQFVVPVVEAGRVASLVILSLSVEVPAGNSDTIFSREPKLRDVFLQVLFEHANAGGFRGTFTDIAAMGTLRRALKEAAVTALGPMISDVLIVDIARQDS